MRILIALCLSALGRLAQPQISPFGCAATPVTGTAWTTSTSINTTQILANPVASPMVMVVVNAGASLTAGAITFQGDYGDGNFITIPVSQVLSPSSMLPLTNPYTLVSSTNQPFLILMSGFKQIQLKLSTAITTSSGVGTTTPFTNQLCYNPSLGPQGQATMAGSIPVVVASDQSNVPDNIKQINGTTVDSNSGSKSAGTMRVVLATDQPALTNKLLVTPDSVALPANQSVNAAQIAGTTTDTNSGSKSAGTLRVVLATDQPALTNKLLVTPDSVALPANQSVNESQINGVTPLMGNGTTGTGSQRVTIASDNTAFAVNSTLSAETTKVIGTARMLGNAGAAVDAATGAAPPANAILLGGLASGATGGFVTALPVADTFFNVNIATATTTLAVTGVSGRHVRITGISLVTALANNVAFISGTGATCGTGSAAIVGTTSATGFNLAANGGIAHGGGLGVIMRTVATGDSVCIITSAATQLSGVISYTIY